MSTPALTLYFDGDCAFCKLEMARLRRWDRYGRLAYVDIAAPGFDPAALGVDMAALNREVHSVDAAGKLLVGIDTIFAAYGLVGRGWLLLPLRPRLLRRPLSALYRSFARNRYRISTWLGLARPVCEDGVCRHKASLL